MFYYNSFVYKNQLVCIYTHFCMECGVNLFLEEMVWSHNHAGGIISAKAISRAEMANDKAAADNVSVPARSI